jgi:hypothetical protein
VWEVAARASLEQERVASAVRWARLAKEARTKAALVEEVREQWACLGRSARTRVLSLARVITRS